MIELTSAEAGRFWAKVDKREGCWLWVAARDSHGYGVLNLRRVHARHMLRAHRVAYQLILGAIPDGLQLDHLCRVTHCVNPAHLEPVTARENVLRGVGPAAIHAAQTRCVHGHEFTQENTITRRNGSRQCRMCKNSLRTLARPCSCGCGGTTKTGGAFIRGHNLSRRGRMAA